MCYLRLVRAAHAGGRGRGGGRGQPCTTAKVIYKTRWTGGDYAVLHKIYYATVLPTVLIKCGLRIVLNVYTYVVDLVSVRNEVLTKRTLTTKGDLYFQDGDLSCLFWDHFCCSVYIIKHGDHFCLGNTLAAGKHFSGRETLFFQEKASSRSSTWFFTLLVPFFRYTCHNILEKVKDFFLCPHIPQEPRTVLNFSTNNNFRHIGFLSVAVLREISRHT